MNRQHVKENPDRKKMYIVEHQSKKFRKFQSTVPYDHIGLF